jgi:O-methyltransferase
VTSPRFSQRWRRSVFRRALTGPVNASGVLLLQTLPEAVTRLSIPFATLRRDWTRGRPKGNDLDLIRMTFLALNIGRLEARGVPGAIAELGVWRGNSAKVIHSLAPGRIFYLFDTFAGFDRNDSETALPDDAMLHFRDTSVAEVKQFLGGSANLRFCPGWFPETAAAVPDEERFAFVHLDCDLYKPMRAALAFFYPRMAVGGMIAIHDFGSGRWPGVAQAVDEFLADKPEQLVCMPDAAGSAMIVRAG